AAEQTYRDYLRGITERLPAATRKLTNNVSIHDGRIERAVYNPAAKTLRLELVCGGFGLWDPEYFKLELAYSEVDFDPRKLAEICRNEGTEALYDEHDIHADGRFIHRIIFYPDYLYIEVAYSKLTLKTKSL